MGIRELQQILSDVRSGAVSVSEAEALIRRSGFADLGVAKIDTNRQSRRGFPETILCLNKTPDQVRAIFIELQKASRTVFATKASEEHWRALKDLSDLRYDQIAKTVTWMAEPAPRRAGVVVASAGTSDLPAAMEAVRTLEVMGCEAQRVFDVGIAGLHRLLAHLEELRSARVIIAVAGMDGALPAVISGLVSCPVVAVPTSVGYGASLGGVAALLTMLNSCSPGVSVVNIDNGFGAGYLAALINLLGPHED